MALTQQQYYEKLKAMVPDWWFEKESVNVGIFQGIAAVFARIHAQADEDFKQTMIKWQNAEGLYLEAHGEERNVPKLTGEPDNVYSERIRNITNSSDRPAIKAIVDALLIRGESIVRDGLEAQTFLNRDCFLNRGEVLTDIFYNVFTIIVENQLHDPYSFMNRENFLSRSDFVGTIESPLAIFEQIFAAVDRAKAFGVLFRILEREAA